MARPLTLVPAAYLIIVRQRPGAVGGAPEVLLQLRAGTGYMDGHWACGVAGHVEPGECVLAAAVREAAEEVGIGVQPADLEPLTTVHRSNDVGGAALEQRVDFFLVLRRWTGEPALREACRTADLGWFPLDALPEPVPPHERAVLEGLEAARRGGAAVPAIMTFGFDGERIERYGTAREHGDIVGNL